MVRRGKMFPHINTAAWFITTMSNSTTRKKIEEEEDEENKRKYKSLEPSVAITESNIIKTNSHMDEQTSKLCYDIQNIGKMYFSTKDEYIYKLYEYEKHKYRFVIHNGVLVEIAKLSGENTEIIFEEKSYVNKENTKR